MSLVIFDMDGTVIDTIHDIHSSLLATLDHYGAKPVSLDMTKQYVGMGMRQLVINAFGENNFKDEMETCFRAIYKDHMMDTTRVMPGFQPVLDLIENKGIKAAILSNKIRQISDDMVKVFHLEKYFAGWYGGDCFGVKKPAPDGVLGIMGEFGAKPEETLMIGDSYSDIIAGTGAGAKTCFCTYGYGTLKGIRPDYSVDSPAGLLQILEEFCA